MLPLPMFKKDQLPQQAPSCPIADHCPFINDFSVKTAMPIPTEALSKEHPRLLKQPANSYSYGSLIGIPTDKGMEFLKAEEIIRCEGCHRCTKVFTEFGEIISAYNVGEFGKLLCASGFFACHKSHLINLRYLRSYCTEGIITLRDGSRVPLARRRREAFLEQVQHL